MIRPSHHLRCGSPAKQAACRALVLGLVLVAACRERDVQLTIRSSSMAPTIVPGQVISGKPLGSQRDVLRRFDLVIFRPPLHPSEFYVMRVIGLPGERVVMTQKSVSINRRTLSDEELPETLRGRTWLFGWITTKSELECKLDGDELFVVGDNLQIAKDSRSWGPLKLQSVLARVDSNRPSSPPLLPTDTPTAGGTQAGSVHIIDRSTPNKRSE